MIEPIGIARCLLESVVQGWEGPPECGGALSEAAPIYRSPAEAASTG